MKISEIMSVNSIVLSLKANNKRQLLQALAEKAAEITGISRSEEHTSELQSHA